MVNCKGGVKMVEYIVGQIILEKLTYEDVIEKYPQYQEQIDKLLTEKGWDNLIKNKRV